MQVKRRRMPEIITIIVLLLASAAGSRAQLPPDIYNTPRPLTAEQERALAEFAQRNVADLKSGDSRALAAARRTLSAAFRRDTSRTFRMAYDAAVTPGLAAIAGDEAASMAARQAAIWLLGPIASDQSDTALAALFSAEEPALRYAAASGVERSMLAIRQERHTYTNPIQNEKAAARSLRDAMAAETNASVLGALTAAAAAMPTAGDSIDALADGLTAQCRRLDEDRQWQRLEAVRVGLERMQKRYVVDMFGGQAIASHERKIIEASASALLLTVRHGAAGAITDQNRRAYGDLARTAENLLNLLCRRDSTQTRVASAVAAGRDADAESAMKSVWLATDGPVYGNRTWGVPPGSIEAGFDR